MLGAASMTLAFKSKDDVGTYHVHAKIVDRVGAQTVEYRVAVSRAFGQSGEQQQVEMALEAFGVHT